jgi:predicted TIM-barrel fold metal-dependent hydrolase
MAAGDYESNMLFQDLTAIPVIDAHVHVFPKKLFEAIKGWFEANAWKFNQQGTAEEFIQTQFDRGAAGLVLMSYAHRPGMSRGLNEFMAGLVNRFPHTVGLAAIHPQDEAPREILKNAFEECGLCGVKMHCHVKGTAPDDPLMFPIYETVLEYDGIVNIHAGREPAIDAYGLDVRAITGAERVEKVLRRFPELKMVIPHMGMDETERFCALMEEFPNLYMDTAMVLCRFFPVTIDRRLLIEHADRILYGTDYPHIPYEMERELKDILAMDLGDDVLNRILFENARKLFPIEPRL